MQPRDIAARGAAAVRPASGIADLTLGNRPRPLFLLIYLVEIRHRQLLQSLSRIRSRVPNTHQVIM
jgi:hypothetical protein